MPQRQQATSAQSRLLKAVRAYIDEKGKPPTIRELCAILNVRSPNSVVHLLKKLRALGYISVEPNTSRGIRIETAGVSYLGEQNGADQTAHQ